MKILLVSMPSLHFFRWTEQLEHSGHEVYWFDIVDGAPTERLPWVHKIRDWKLKYPNLKGRHFIKKNWPCLYRKFSGLIENNTEDFFEKIIKDIQPDVVHSFALQISCISILSIMKKYSSLKWIYSSWGSDIYYSKEIGIDVVDMKACLRRINFLITDCKRDYEIAQKNDFNSTFLGVFPGNGGVNYIESEIEYDLDNRNIILIKGYNDSIGKGINIIKAFTKETIELLKDKQIIIFGADDEIERYIKLDPNFLHLNYKIYNKAIFINNKELVRLMGKSLIYIANSYSDGIPNSLLEAMGMGAFPIQSNPGNATSEIIVNNKNGFLISNPDDINEIERLIKKAFIDKILIHNAFLFNTKSIKKRFNRSRIKRNILNMYNGID